MAGFPVRTRSSSLVLVLASVVGSCGTDSRGTAALDGMSDTNEAAEAGRTDAPDVPVDVGEDAAADVDRAADSDAAEQPAADVTRDSSDDGATSGGPDAEDAADGAAVDGGDACDFLGGECACAELGARCCFPASGHVMVCSSGRGPPVAWNHSNALYCSEDPEESREEWQWLPLPPDSVDCAEVAAEIGARVGR